MFSGISENAIRRATNAAKAAEQVALKELEKQRRTRKGSTGKPKKKVVINEM
jgi:hypothetical protein